jgi:hypothetical protein
MQIRNLLICWRMALLVTPLVLAGCDSAGPVAPLNPTAPTGTSADAALAVNAISTVPAGAGVQFNTDFQFTATGSFPAGTEFVWRFGDGSTATTTAPTVGRIYGQAGAFDVSVEARHGGQSVAAFKQVSVRSLIGRWIGTVTGHTSFPLQRPVAITGFELLVVNQTPAADGRSLMLHGRWADNAGCRETRPELVRQVLQPEPLATVLFGVNGLSCASGDFFLGGLADAAFDRVDGHCNVIGGNPDCRFSMRRE